MKNNSIYTVKKNYAIYLLLDKESKTFFIWYSVLDSLANTYRRHFTEKISKTKTWINNLKNENKKPCIFILESGEMTRPECFKLTLIWNKIFLENNFLGIESENILNESQDIYEENIEQYENRKTININEIINCNKCILPNYSFISCEKYIENGIEKLKREPKKKKRIEIKLDDDEFETINEKAFSLNMKPTDYIKKISVEGEIINYNFDVIKEFTEEITEVKKTLNRYIITLISMDGYFPKELENIQQSIDALVETENKILKKIQNEQRRKRKKERKENK